MDKPFWPPENYYRVSLKPLIFDDEGRLLVGRDEEDAWTMLGGGWDHAEDYQSCLRREVAEELGAKVISIGPMAFFYRCKAAQGQPKIAMAFPVKLQNFDFKLDPVEVLEAKFVTKEEFLQLPFQEGEAPVQAYADQIWPLVEKNSENR